MNKYPVVFAIDKNYILPLSVALISLLKNNSNKCIEIYVLHDDLTETDQKLIKKCIYSDFVQINFYNIDSSVFDNYKTGYHFTKAIFYRLLIPDIFKNKFDKVLYIDSDALILGDISTIFDVNLEDNYLAAVSNIGFDRYESLGIEKSHGYFASGTILFNVKKWISDDIFLRLSKYLEGNKHVLMPDQDALNVIVDGKWRPLDIGFGVETSLIDAVYNNDYTEYKESVFSPVIVHFSGSSKPWHFANKHKYKKEFNRYLKLTPFHPYKPSDFTFRNILISLIPRPVQVHIKKLLSLI
ncbi:MAG: hypothetical protein CTY18_01850 [Methylomonas sp.]|nr:MAG: hypothetical protein CTY18_01850 [Methylomonas sp.]